ncbi:DUF2726 domain-containing protein [Roseimaritima sediminicola]|uniref:DUF2726 domain-containing protein n=1 Tax=Roseimaritima sediminicola TaxID=2662066 RepID=UPI00129830D2|nr:DUF2726 domain-containing protein [Roseimaritima sediminicola]
MAESQRSGCLGFFLRVFGFNSGDGTADASEELPYRLRTSFLSPAELAFYRVLEQAAPQYSINNKVRLWDVLYVPRAEGSRRYENKISSKHVDFLLCDPATMQPVLAIELDDSSHNRQDRQDRDAFVDKAFAAARLPILHVAASRNYSATDLRDRIAACIHGESPAVVSGSDTTVREPASPLCSKCDTSMVLRTATRGKHAGRQFWACVNYPKCRELVGID